MYREITRVTGVFLCQFLIVAAATAQTVADCPTGTVSVDGINNVIVDDGAGWIYTDGEYGIFRSCDRGETWQKSMSERRIPATVTVDRVSRQYVYYSSGNRLYRSDNHGESFARVDGDQIDAFEISALTVRVDGSVLAGTSAGIYTSTDRGDTWQKLPATDWGTSISTILVDVDNPNVFYAGTCTEGIYRTTDGGSTWDQFKPSSGDWHVAELLYDPGNAATIFAAAYAGLWRSVDAGTTWTQATTTSARSLVFDPDDPRRAFLLTYSAGVFRSLDGGTTWIPVFSWSPDQAPKFVSIDAIPGGRLLAGTQHDQIYISDDSGTTWRRVEAQPPASPVPPAPGSRSASLTLDAQLLNEDGSVSAGADAVFRITLRNNGPDSATNAFVDFAWFHQKVIGGKDYFAFSASSREGSCGSAGTHYCQFASIPSGSGVSVEFRGKTAPRELRYYSLSIVYGSDVSGTYTAETGVGAAVTVWSSGGGGTFDIVFIALLVALVATARCMADLRLVSQCLL